MEVIALGIGNTSLKVALVETRTLDVIERRRFPVDQEASPQDLREMLAKWDEALPRVAVSVNPPHLEIIERNLSSPLIVLGRDLSVPIENLTDPPEHTGTDRLVCAYAARALLGAPVVAVDFGTALTVNLVDRKGAFVGGAIAPGPGLAAAGLAGGCAQLPLIAPTDGDIPLIGDSTEAAIRSGIYNGWLGLVDSLTGRYLNAGGAGCRVAATGGAAAFFVERSHRFSLYDPDLVLKGAALIIDAVSTADFSNGPDEGES